MIENCAHCCIWNSLFAQSRSILIVKPVTVHWNGIFIPLLYYSNFFDIQIIIPSSTSKVTQETHLPPLRNIKYLFQQYARYLSNRPQVSMGYKLINHAGCLLCNTRRIHKRRILEEFIIINWNYELWILRVFYQHPKWCISL